MAGIDKIVGNNIQCTEFRKWCEENYPEALDYMCSGEHKQHVFHTISNFPEEVDMYLLENCPISWVTDRIKFQYGMDGDE